MEKELAKETVYEGKIITVTKEKVLLEDGNTSYREVVYHHGGVCILAIEDDKIMMVKQFRYPNRMNLLEIPAGKLEIEEDPLDCAYRELEEETNYRAKNMKFLFKFLTTPGYCNECLYLYEAHDFKEVDDALKGDDDEFIEVVKIPVDEAYQMVMNGEIIDGKSITAIMYAYSQKHQ